MSLSTRLRLPQSKPAKRLECAVFRRFRVRSLISSPSKAPKCGALQTLRDWAAASPPFPDESDRTAISPGRGSGEELGGGLRGPGQGTAYVPGFIDDAGRFLPRLSRAGGLCADAEPAIGHGAGGQRRLSFEPVMGAGAGCQDAPDTGPAAARRATAAADRPGAGLRVGPARSALSGAGGESSDGRARRGFIAELRAGLYAAQAIDLAEHARRRSAGRFAAVDGLDGGAQRVEQRGVGAVCDSGLVAGAAFSGDRLDVSRGVCQGWF